MKHEDEYINRITNRVTLAGVIAGTITLPDCGVCSVVVGTNERGWEHVSVSPSKKYKMPTWDDMCYLKNIFWQDEEEAYQIMPKKSEYVNVKDNCLHLWKPIGHELAELINFKGGIKPKSYDKEQG